LSTKTCFVMASVMKLCAVKATLYLWSDMNLYLYVQCLLSNLGKIQCKLSEHNTVEFHENRHREGHTFLMGVNKITFTCVLISLASPSHPYCLTYILHLLKV
jgi:hypothetical protein